MNGINDLHRINHFAMIFLIVSFECLYFVSFIKHQSPNKIPYGLYFWQVLQSLKSKMLDLSCALQSYIHCHMKVSTGRTITNPTSPSIFLDMGLNSPD